MHRAGIFSRDSGSVIGRTSSFPATFKIGIRVDERRGSIAAGGTLALAISVKKVDKADLSLWESLEKRRARKWS